MTQGLLVGAVLLALALAGRTYTIVVTDYPDIPDRQDGRRARG